MVMTVLEIQEAVAMIAETVSRLVVGEALMPAGREQMKKCRQAYAALMKEFQKRLTYCEDYLPEKAELAQDVAFADPDLLKFYGLLDFEGLAAWRHNAKRLNIEPPPAFPPQTVAILRQLYGLSVPAPTSGRQFVPAPKHKPKPVPIPKPAGPKPVRLFRRQPSFWAAAAAAVLLIGLGGYFIGTMFWTSAPSDAKTADSSQTASASSAPAATKGFLATAQREDLTRRLERIQNAYISLAARPPLKSHPNWSQHLQTDLADISARIAAINTPEKLAAVEQTLLKSETLLGEIRSEQDRRREAQASLQRLDESLTTLKTLPGFKEENADYRAALASRKTAAEALQAEAFGDSLTASRAVLPRVTLGGPLYSQFAAVTPTPPDSQPSALHPPLTIATYKEFPANQRSNFKIVNLAAQPVSDTEWADLLAAHDFLGKHDIVQELQAQKKNISHHAYRFDLPEGKENIPLGLWQDASPPQGPVVTIRENSFRLNAKGHNDPLIMIFRVRGSIYYVFSPLAMKDQRYQSRTRRLDNWFLDFQNQTVYLCYAGFPHLEKLLPFNKEFQKPIFPDNTMKQFYRRPSSSEWQHRSPAGKILTLLGDNGPPWLTKLHACKTKVNLITAYYNANLSGDVVSVRPPYDQNIRLIPLKDHLGMRIVFCKSPTDQIDIGLLLRMTDSEGEYLVHVLNRPALDHRWQSPEGNAARYMELQFYDAQKNWLSCYSMYAANRFAAKSRGKFNSRCIQPFSPKPAELYVDGEMVARGPYPIKWRSSLGPELEISQNTQKQLDFKWTINGHSPDSNAMKKFENGQYIQDKIKLARFIKKAQPGISLHAESYDPQGNLKPAEVLTYCHFSAPHLTVPMVFIPEKGILRGRMALPEELLSKLPDELDRPKVIFGVFLSFRTVPFGTDVTRPVYTGNNWAKVKSAYSLLGKSFSFHLISPSERETSLKFTNTGKEVIFEADLKSIPLFAPIFPTQNLEASLLKLEKKAAEEYAKTASKDYPKDVAQFIQRNRQGMKLKQDINGYRQNIQAYENKSETDPALAASNKKQIDELNEKIRAAESEITLLQKKFDDLRQRFVIGDKGMELLSIRRTLAALYWKYNLKVTHGFAPPELVTASSKDRTAVLDATHLELVVYARLGYVCLRLIPKLADSPTSAWGGSSKNK